MWADPWSSGVDTVPDPSINPFIGQIVQNIHGSVPSYIVSIIWILGKSSGRYCINAFVEPGESAGGYCAPYSGKVTSYLVIYTYFWLNCLVFKNQLCRKKNLFLIVKIWNKHENMTKQRFRKAIFNNFRFRKVVWC